MAVAEPYLTPPAVRGLGRLRELHTVSRRATLGDRFAIGAFALLILVAVAAPVLAPHDPIQPVGMPFLAPGQGGSLFGTDEVGQDILTRVLFGLRASLLAAGVVIGGAVGLAAGAAGGWVDNVLMRITDAFLALPGPVLAIAVVAALGPSFDHTL